MDIYVYGFGEGGALRLKGITDRVISAKVTRRFFAGGSFEAVLPATEHNLALFGRGCVIEIPYRMNGYADSFSVEEGTDKSVIRISGSTFDGTISRRVVLNASHSDSIMDILDGNAGASAGARRLPGLVFDRSADCASGFDLSMKYIPLDIFAGKAGSREGFGVLSEIVHGEEPYIRIYGRYGVDRSAEQDENPRMIFSEEFDNIRGLLHSDSSAKAMTNAVVYSKGAIMGSSGQYAVPEWNRCFGTYDGWNSFEKAYEISPQTKTVTHSYSSGGTTYITFDQELDITASNNAGKQIEAAKYKGLCSELKMSLEIDENYRGKFEIGDIVTSCSRRLGIIQSTRINEITERYENGGFSAEAVLSAL